MLSAAEDVAEDYRLAAGLLEPIVGDRDAADAAAEVVDRVATIAVVLEVHGPGLREGAWIGLHVQTGGIEGVTDVGGEDAEGCRRPDWGVVGFSRVLPVRRA